MIGMVISLKTSGFIYQLKWFIIKDGMTIPNRRSWDPGTYEKWEWRMGNFKWGWGWVFPTTRTGTGCTGVFGHVSFHFVFIPKLSVFLGCADRDEHSWAIDFGSSCVSIAAHSYRSRSVGRRLYLPYLSQASLPDALHTSSNHKQANLVVPKRLPKLPAIIACLPSLESDGGCHECLVLRSLPQREKEKLRKDGPAPDPKISHWYD